MDAAAGQQQRPLGPGDQPRGALDVGAVGADAPRRRLQRRLVDDEILGREIVAPWQTSSGTSSSTGPGRPEVATAKARRTSSGMRLVISTRISSLTAGLQDFDLAAFLGHVLPGMRAVGVAGDRDDRDAAIQRLDEAGDEVGRAGAERAVANAGAVGDPGIGVGGKGAAALVVDQVVVQADQAERVVERQQLEPAHAEHRPGARQTQHLGERAPAVHRARRAVLP